MYAAGTIISSMSQSMNLAAQWKDVQKPDVAYNGVQVVTHTSDEEVEKLVQDSLTITDNEPVSECTVTISIDSSIADTAGEKTVSVTVKDKAGNTTVKNCIVKVVAQPVAIQNPVFTESTKTLAAKLREPGSDEITETGFVWGVMNNPTLSLNNGKASTNAPVKTADSTITVTADNLQKGVAYYARAYVVAGGITYYSNEISVGLGLPAYGTFTIKNNGNNAFTVTRSGGSEETQTVYYRTVNSSAVGGTHFTHAAGTLTFKSGETSKTITITETTANTAYSGNAATAYTNADRTYQVELYRVTGGGTLGSTVTATRTMTAKSGYKVDRSIYTEEKAKSHDVTNKWVTDHSGSGDGNIYWRSDRDKNTNTNKDNFNSSRTIDAASYPNVLDYIKGTAHNYLYRYDMTAHEDEDGWENAWMGTSKPGNAGTETKLSGSYAGKPISLTDSVAGNAVWTAVFQVAEGNSAAKSFPTKNINTSEDKGNEGKEKTVYAYNAGENIIVSGGTCYAKIPVSDTVYNYFSASGANQDRWYVESFTDYTKIYDTQEPQLLSVALMAGGLYKTGDSFTVALIFDEIVDSVNSKDISSVILETNWGNVSYAGGADTNVLYFTGMVSASTNDNLTVNRIRNSENIKDMCDECETVCSGGSGSTTASVDIASANFTVVSNGITAGTGTAKITVNADKTKTTGLKYAWSDTAAMPVSGWIEASGDELADAKTTGGLSLSIRKQPGSGAGNGKWYLHVVGTYSNTGAASYKSVVLDFGTEASPAAGSTALSLTVSADNSRWAKSRVITADAEGGGTLKYRFMGETNWKDLSGSSVTVTANGYYTFILTDGEQTITKNIKIEKVDNVKPAAAVSLVAAGSTDESGTIETKKQGVYTKITLSVMAADSESYIAKLEYKWTNSSATPASGWISADTDISQLTYTASENTETTKYLHLRVIDAAGNTFTTKSQAYTLISQTAVDNHTPGITFTGAPGEWTNDMPTLKWELTDYSGKNYTVTLPDGKTVTEASGGFLATQNGTYTVTVLDNEYGGSRTATLTVDKIDITSPEVTVTGVPEGWKNSSQSVTLTVSDNQSGIGNAYYKLVRSASETPQDGLTEFTGSSQTINVTDNGIWYVYYKIYDNTADDTIGRPANVTEGFAGPVQIDTTALELTISGGLTGAAELDLALQVSYGPSGGKVTVDGSILSELTALAGTESTGTTKNTAYKVTEKGIYIFLAENGAGKTASQSATVYEAIFKACTGTAQNVTADDVQLVIKGGKLTEPEEIPFKQGYTFTGWFTEEEGGRKWDFENDVINQDITLYAHWEANTYLITYEKDGGTIEHEDDYTDYTYGTGLKLPEPEREGAVFDGWYMYSDFKGERVTAISDTDIGNKIYYAKWIINQYKVVLTSGEGYTIIGENDIDSVSYGDSFTFYVEVAEGYDSSGMVVKVNDEEVILTGFNYTITNIHANQTVIVEGVADTTAPTAEIIVGSNRWSSLLNPITFGMFFKEKQTVTILAQDKGSGLNTTEYYVSNRSMTEEEVKALTEWTSYTEVFDIGLNNRYVIYAKLTDNAGNKKYISTDGMVIENIAPVVKGITDGAIYCESVTFTVEDENMDTVTVDGNVVLEVDGAYTIPADNRSHTVVATDKAGNSSAAITVTVNDGHSWDEGEVIREVNCTEKGIKVYTCTVCQETLTEDIEELGHDFAEDFTVDAEATCTEAGSKSRYCSRCDEVTDVTEIAAAGHSWGKPVFEWDGFTAAIAIFTCEADIFHEEVIECSITSQITKQATGTEKGEIIYTATAVFGDKIYTDTKTQETSKIAAEVIGSGTLETEVNVAENVPNVVVGGLTPEAVKHILTEEELREIESGEDVLIHLEITNINNTVNKEEQSLVENCLKELADALVKNDSELVSSKQVKTGVMYLDLSLYKKVGNEADIKIYNTKGNMFTVEVEIPEEFKSDEKERTYTVIRIHEDESGNTVAEALPTTQNGDVFSFKTDRFSTYAICYTQKDLDAEINADSVTISQKEICITEKNGTVELVATVLPAEANNKNVTWFSSDTNVATVDENGKVTAVGNGTAIITVTTEDGAKTASCTVTVEFTTDDDDNTDDSDINGDNDNTDDSDINGDNDSNDDNNENNTNPSLPADGGTDGLNEAPQTDDPNNLWIWRIYLIVSLGVFLAAAIGGRKKKTKNV